MPLERGVKLNGTGMAKEPLEIVGRQVMSCKPPIMHLGSLGILEKKAAVIVPERRMSSSSRRPSNSICVAAPEPTGFIIVL